jgi:hypothetical protein
MLGGPEYSPATTQAYAVHLRLTTGARTVVSTHRMVVAYDLAHCRSETRRPHGVSNLVVTRVYRCPVSSASLRGRTCRDQDCPDSEVEVALSERPARMRVAVDQHMVSEVEDRHSGIDQMGIEKCSQAH